MSMTNTLHSGSPRAFEAKLKSGTGFAHQAAIVTGTALSLIALWAGLHVHEVTLSEKAPARVETVSARPVSTDDAAAAAKFEQFALARLAPLKPESEVLQSLKAPAPIEVKTLAEPATSVVRLPPRRDKTFAAKPAVAVLPLSHPGPLNLVADAEPAAPVAPVTVPAKPSVLERVAASVPGSKQVADGVGSTVDFVESLLPKFKW